MDLPFLGEDPATAYAETERTGRWRCTATLLQPARPPTWGRWDAAETGDWLQAGAHRAGHRLLTRYRAAPVEDAQ